MLESNFIAIKKLGFTLMVKQLYDIKFNIIENSYLPLDNYYIKNIIVIAALNVPNKKWKQTYQTKLTVWSQKSQV